MPDVVPQIGWPPSPEVVVVLGSKVVVVGADGSAVVVDVLVVGGAVGLPPFRTCGQNMFFLVFSANA